MNTCIIYQNIHLTEPRFNLRHTPRNVRAVRHVKTTPAHHQAFTPQRPDRLLQSGRIDVIKQ